MPQGVTHSSCTAFFYECLWSVKAEHHQGICTPWSKHVWSPDLFNAGIMVTLQQTSFHFLRFILFNFTLFKCCFPEQVKGRKLALKCFLVINWNKQGPLEPFGLQRRKFSG